ncbi:MAG: hypothetical protein ACHQ1G_06320 [Planctomycetota bacterium]
MDFWAQHKDFILKILAGVGVFLVALIARGITYGNELETEQAKNDKLVREIASTPVAPMPRIQELEADKERLTESARSLATQVGWNLGDEMLERTLLERILKYTRRYAREGDDGVRRAAEDFRSALRENLNGGFGQLRLMVRQQLVEEANERNIKVTEELGVGSVIQMEPDELLQYLLQLELVARVVRYAIDARVDSVETIGITTAGSRRAEVIPGANPDFIQEYEVKLAFTASQPALRTIVDRLEQELPRAALAEMRATRVMRPVDHLSVEMTLLATASNPDVPFAKEKP